MLDQAKISSSPASCSHNGPPAASENPTSRRAQHAPLQLLVRGILLFNPIQCTANLMSSLVSRLTGLSLMANLLLKPSKPAVIATSWGNGFCRKNDVLCQYPLLVYPKSRTTHSLHGPLEQISLLSGNLGLCLHTSSILILVNLNFSVLRYGAHLFPFLHAHLPAWWVGPAP